MTSGALPPEHQAGGQGMIPASEEDMLAVVVEPGSPLEAGFAFRCAIVAGDLELARWLVTPESLDNWGDFGWARDLLAGTAMMTRAQEPAPGVAYVSFLPDAGQSQVAAGDVLLMARAIATLVFRQESGRWQVHGLGDYLLPEDLPAGLA